MGTSRLQALRILTLEPERLRTDPPLPEEKSPEIEKALTRDAQAACEFSLLQNAPYPEMITRARAGTWQLDISLAVSKVFPFIVAYQR